MTVLKDLLVVSKDGEWGKADQFSGSELMTVIRGTDFETVRIGSLDGVPQRWIAQKAADRKRIEAWDIIIETAGGSKNRPTGRTLLIQPSLAASAATSLICASFARFLRIDTRLAHPPFVFWLLQHLYTNGTLYKYHTQHTGVARFQYTTFAENEPLELPPLPTQHRITSILSAYDDLIENNTRRIEILEEMARRLYEEWFVHFRFPGHEQAEFAETEFGRSPSEWPVVGLDELVQVNPKTTVPREGLKPFVPMGSLSETSMIIGPLEEREGNSGTKFQNGDTLVARITPCLENGKTGFVDFLNDERPVAFGSTEFIVLRPKVLGKCAIYCLARSHAFRDVAIRSMSGAEGRQRVRPESVQSFPIARPPAELLDRFERLCGPSFLQISALARKNTNLRAQRDLLLPKLVSGEIDMSEAEKSMEAAE